MKINLSSVIILILILLAGTSLVSAQPPDLPSSFHGEIQILDDAPVVGDDVVVYLDAYPGTPVITTDLFLDGELLVYTVDVPGTAAADTGKDVIFVIGTRIMAKGIWASGAETVQLNFHPPQAISGGPYSGAVNSAIHFSASANDTGSDVASYAWDWNNDGTYDETGQAPSHTWNSIGSKTVNLKVTDAQAGEDVATFTVSVDTLAATITITNLNQTYGSVSAPTVTTDPPGLGYSITYDGSPTLPTAAGSYAVDVTITDPDYTGSGSGTLVIDKASTTTAVTGGTFTYDGQAHAAAVTVTGAGGLSLTPDPVYGGTCSAAPINATTPDCTAGYTYAGDSNHYGSTDTDTIVVNPKPTSVTPATAGKTYGETDPALSGSLEGFLAADSISAVYNRISGETVAGSPYTISATLSPAEKLGNYDITYNTAAFTINPKAASVTPNAASKIIGESDPALTGTLSGFLAGDNVSAIYDRADGETPGTYTISSVLSPAGVLANYSITYNTAILTIYAKHSISLEAGWNLVSFNLIPINTSIEEVLSPVEGNYDQVYAWDASTQDWLVFDPLETGSNTLTALDRTMGFWIYMNTADTLDVIGTQPVSTHIVLKPGWNLVGYPSDDTMTPASTGKALIYAYHAAETDYWKLFDVTAPDYASDLTSIQPGWGYWIKVTATDTWDVTY